VEIAHCYFEGQARVLGGAIRLGFSIQVGRIFDCRFDGCFVGPTFYQREEGGPNAGRNVSSTGYGGAICVDCRVMVVSRVCGINCSAYYLGHFLSRGGSWNGNETVITNFSLFSVLACRDRSFNSSWLDGDGVVALDRSTNATVESLNFTMCLSRSGCAIHAIEARSGQCSPNCLPSVLSSSFLTVVSCTGTTGLNFSVSRTPTISYSNFYNNSITAAVIVAPRAGILIANCIFNGNYARDVNWSLSSLTGTIVIRECVFSSSIPSESLGYSFVNVSWGTITQSHAISGFSTAVCPWSFTFHFVPTRGLPGAEDRPTAFAATENCPPSAAWQPLSSRVFTESPADLIPATGLFGATHEPLQASEQEFFRLPVSVQLGGSAGLSPSIPFLASGKISGSSDFGARHAPLRSMVVADSGKLVASQHAKTPDFSVPDHWTATAGFTSLDWVAPTRPLASSRPITHSVVQPSVMATSTAHHNSPTSRPSPGFSLFTTVFVASRSVSPAQFDSSSLREGSDPQDAGSGGSEMLIGLVVGAALLVITVAVLLFVFRTRVEFTTTYELEEEDRRDGSALISAEEMRFVTQERDSSDNPTVTLAQTLEPLPAE
jgi:hypothetical protein